MLHTIFISRDISKTNSIRITLGDYAIIKAFSLIEFNPIPFESFPHTDFIFFYSKNAAKYFLSHASVSLKGIRIACMGSGTAYFLKESGIIPDFVGKGNPNEVAADFLSLAKGKKVLFPQAKNSRKSIQKILGEHIVSFDLIVYNNSKKKKFQNPKADILVFTSPMNVEAYFEYLDYKNEEIIAIGNTTLDKLKEFNFEKTRMAEKPTEEALLHAIKEIIF